MYNLRYHIWSLASVFIALALGLVLGGLIVDGTPKSSQQAIIDSLRADFASVREQSAQTQATNDYLAKFSDGVALPLITKQLTGYSVVVLGSGDACADEVQNVVTQAGASVVSINIHEDFLDIDKTDSKAAPLVAQLMKGKDGETVALQDELAKELVDEWIGQKKYPFTEALIEDDVLDMAVPDASYGQVLGIIDTLTASGQSHDLSSALARTFAAKQLVAITATMQDMSDAEVVNIGETNISSTNMVGSTIGSYTLVALLKGGQIGRYGTMKKADALFAPLPDVLSLAGQPVVSEESKTKKK